MGQCQFPEQMPIAVRWNSSVMRGAQRADPCEHLVDETPHLLDVEGLHDKGRPRILEKRPLLRIKDIPCDEDRPLSERRKATLDLAIEADAVEARHPGVADDEVTGERPQDLQRLRAI